jgi:hypothetical protein
MRDFLSGSRKQVVFGILFTISATVAQAQNAPKYVILDTHKLKAGKTMTDAMKIEEAEWKELWMSDIKDGNLLRWSNWRTSQAMGRTNSYDYITLREYAAWKDMGAPGGENYKKFNASHDGAARLTKAREVSDVVNLFTLHWLAGTEGPRKYADTESAHFQFLKVKSPSEYVAFYKTVFLAVAQDAVKRGVFLSRDLYEVRYPAGEDAEFNVVMITRTSNFENQEHAGGGTTADVRRVFPNLDIAATMKKRDDMRKVIREQITRIGPFAQN